MESRKRQGNGAMFMSKEIDDFELLAGYYRLPKDSEGRMFVTKIGIIEESEVEKVRTVCENIQKMDDTFIFEIKDTTFPEFVKVLAIYSDSKEMANKRGGWIIHKMRDAKVADYFWVRETKNESNSGS